jgi:hypothetical protein
MSENDNKENEGQSTQNPNTDNKKEKKIEWSD